MDLFVNGLLSVDATALGPLAQSPAISLALTELLAREVVAASGLGERAGLHSVVAALAGVPSTLSFVQLSLYAGAFEATNTQLVAETLTRALEGDVLLAKQCVLLGPAQLVAALAPAQSQSQSQSFADMAQRVRLALALARSCARLRSVYGSTQAVLSALSAAYSTLLPSAAPPPAALAAAEPAALAYLALRLDVLETAHAILAAAFLDRLASDSLSTAARSALWEELTHTLRPTLDALPPFPKPHGVPLVDRTLLGDLHHFFRLGDLLQAAAGMATERREIADQIRRLDVREVEWDALELLRDAPGAAVEVRADKGKGKATISDDTQTATDTSLTLALSQILDVLPDLSPAFLTACLSHPRFGYDPEQVVAALLEDDLPPELRALRDGHPPEPTPVEPTWTPEPAPVRAVPVSTRSNIFDDDARFNAGKLRRGKSTATADLLLADRSFLTDELKAAIIERAERESSDEDDDDGDGDQDLDTGAEGKGFKVRDGEDGEDDVDEVEGKGEVQPPPSPVALPRDALANPITPPIAKLLEQAYLSDPTVFDRTSAIKRSKARADLRDRSGLADEQLEGWRAMLERNPKKDKILARHEFAGNKPNDGEDGEGQGVGGGQQGPSRQQGQSSRGGRGRGGGDGARGGGARGGRGKSDGGRAKSDRRTRGADRKMAKVA